MDAAIGHLKSEGLPGWNFPRGMAGDVTNALLRGASRNRRKILATLSQSACQEAMA